MEKKTKNKKRKIIIVAVVVVLVLAIVILILNKSGYLSQTPTLKIETPEKRSFGDSEPFTVDVTISGLGDEKYPAASFSIDFDNSRLEFLGVEEGNLMILDGDNAGKLPEWSVNIEESNKSGTINIIYLDMTGGKNSFARELLEEDDNIVLRLEFRLRGSARKGDAYELVVADAVFAANDENKSLASANDTLKTVNGRIVVEK